MKSLLQHFASLPDGPKKAFLDAVNEFGNTALHWAALNGHLAVVKLLVEAGASPALANDKNYVPLDLASLNDKVDVVDYFLSTSAEPESATNGSGAGEPVDFGDDEEGEAGGEGGDG